MTPSPKQDVTIWVPSLGTRCGIAEYAGHLAEATTRLAAAGRRVALARNPPTPTEPSVLHIQHEYALFDDNVLADQVAACCRARVPVIITEHSIIVRQWVPDEVGEEWQRLFLTPQHTWENDADALVALSGDGASILRDRWPGTAVHHIPHACPTWFPPRKKNRGRVIGAFGFLAPYKGFRKLLGVLRAQQDLELLIYSYPGDPETERAWEQEIEGLPVRWVRSFRPEEEVTRELAARADILVYWYDQGLFASASGAVRLGLSTGVPVLTSPTRLFSDLTGVTYQPDDLLDGVRRLLDDSALRRELTDAAYDYCHINNWSDTARRHLKLWNEAST